jgi:hypothetical protein
VIKILYQNLFYIYNEKLNIAKWPKSFKERREGFGGYDK